MLVYSNSEFYAKSGVFFNITVFLISITIAKALRCKEVVLTAVDSLPGMVWDLGLSAAN